MRKKIRGYDWLYNVVINSFEMTLNSKHRTEKWTVKIQKHEKSNTARRKPSFTYKLVQNTDSYHTAKNKIMTARE